MKFLVFLVCVVAIVISGSGCADEKNKKTKTEDIATQQSSEEQTLTEETEATYEARASVENIKLPTLNLKEIEAVKYLTADVMQQVKMLERDIKIYHWTSCYSLPKIDDPDERGEDAWRFVQQITQKAWNFAHNSSGADLAAGQGLYAANDPISSSKFGNCLIEITLPKGARYLDITLSTLGSIKVRKNTIEKIKDAGCVPEINPKFFYSKQNDKNESLDFINYRVAIDAVECNKITMASMKAAGVMAVNHIWFDRLLLPNCKGGRGGTFVLIQTDGLSKKNIANIKSNKRINSRSITIKRNEYEKDLERKVGLLAKEYKEFRDRFSSFELRSGWSGSGHNNSKMNKEIQKWKDKYIFKCGDYKSEEDLLDIDGLSPTEADIIEAANRVDALYVQKIESMN